jgi:tetratricopeptide (TPR) repeat protein
MIVRNEEENLGRCLASVRDLVDEVVVVDTGSTDGTRSLAASFGASVHDFAWVDDFAAARNEGLRHATGEWVFWLDADEWLEPADRERLRALFSGLGGENLAFVMTQRCLGQSDLAGGGGGADTPVEQVRLFRNLPGLHWRHRVYEQIISSVREQGGGLRKTDVVIQHPGYQDPALHRAKVERNLRLARLEHDEHPQDAYVHYALGSFHQLLGDMAGSLPYLRGGIERLLPGATFGAKLFALLTQGHQRLGRVADALVVCRAGRERYPDDPELQAQERALSQVLPDLAEAARLVNRLAQGCQEDPTSSLERALLRQARHHLALTYRGARRFAEAEAQWRTALAEAPEFDLGWLELGELYVSLGRWDDLESVVNTLQYVRRRTEDAAVLRARGQVFRKEFAEARRLLDAAITLAPRSVRPRLVLSQCYLIEGRDPEAAERALNDVLRLDPSNAAARHNLATLLARKDKAPA